MANPVAESSFANSAGVAADEQERTPTARHLDPGPAPRQLAIDRSSDSYEWLSTAENVREQHSTGFDRLLLVASIHLRQLLRHNQWNEVNYREPSAVTSAGNLGIYGPRRTVANRPRRIPKSQVGIVAPIGRCTSFEQSA